MSSKSSPTAYSTSIHLNSSMQVPSGFLDVMVLFKYKDEWNYGKWNVTYTDGFFEACEVFKRSIMAKNKKQNAHLCSRARFLKKVRKSMKASRPTVYRTSRRMKIPHSVRIKKNSKGRIKLLRSHKNSIQMILKNPFSFMRRY